VHSSHWHHLSLLPASPPGHCQPPYQMCQHPSPAKQHSKCDYSESCFMINEPVVSNA